MERIFGLLFSGAAVRLFSIGAAVYVANMAWQVLGPAMDAVSNGMTVLN